MKKTTPASLIVIALTLVASSVPALAADSCKEAARQAGENAYSKDDGNPAMDERVVVVEEGRRYNVQFNGDEDGDYHYSVSTERDGSRCEVTSVYATMCSNAAAHGVCPDN